MPLRNVQELVTVTAMDVAATIKTLLDGRKHRVLIDATGIDESRMSRILSGATHIRVGEIQLIEAAFGLLPGQLIALAVEASESSPKSAVRSIATAAVKRHAKPAVPPKSAAARPKP